MLNYNVISQGWKSDIESHLVWSTALHAGIGVHVQSLGKVIVAGSGITKLPLLWVDQQVALPSQIKTYPPAHAMKWSGR